MAWDHLWQPKMTVYKHIITVVKSLAFKESRYVENDWKKKEKYQVVPVSNTVTKLSKEFQLQ